MCVQFQSQFSDFLENLLLSWTMYRPLYYRLCTVQSSSLHCKLFTRHRTLNSVQCSLSISEDHLFFLFLTIYIFIYFFLFYRLLRFTNTYLLIDISCLFIFNEDSSCTFLVKKIFYSLSFVIYLFLTSSPSSHFFFLYIFVQKFCFTSSWRCIFIKMKMYKLLYTSSSAYIWASLY